MSSLPIVLYLICKPTVSLSVKRLPNNNLETRQQWLNFFAIVYSSEIKFPVGLICFLLLIEILGTTQALVDSLRCKLVHLAFVFNGTKIGRSTRWSQRLQWSHMVCSYFILKGFVIHTSYLIFYPARALFPELCCFGCNLVMKVLITLPEV